MKSLKPLRSLLFLPATATAMLAKATQRGADALIVDLEDSVTPDRKAEARGLAAAAVQDLAARGATVLLRVNSEPALWRADLERLPLQWLAAVMLPKVEGAAAVDELAHALARAGHADLPVVALVESPRGVLAAAAVAAHPAVAALAFGTEDYAAALGVAPEPAALTGPAQHLLTCAHAFGRQAFGLAASIAVVDDEAAFAASARAARAMGFTGALCIHPRQVGLLNDAFSPSAAQREWALRVVEADRAAQAAGQGAVMLDGRMVDRPVVERARRWLTVPG